MSADATDLANRSLRARKLRDAALILPLTGLFLFLTPVPGMFSSSGAIPTIFLFIYGAWLALIIASAVVSSALVRDETTEPRADGRP